MTQNYVVPPLTDKGAASLAAIFTEAGLPTDEAFIFQSVAWFGWAHSANVKNPDKSSHPKLMWSDTAALTGHRLHTLLTGLTGDHLPVERYRRTLPPVNLGLSWSRPLFYSERTQPWIVSFDVNAQYLPAMNQELPTGEEVHRTRNLDANDIKLPGYYRLDVADDPADDGPFALPDLRTDDGWYVAPVAKYLLDRGRVENVREAVVWPQHRAWLKTWYARCRDARTLLMARKGPGPVAGADAARKAMYAAFVGYLASDRYNRSKDLYRPEWRDAIHGLAHANQLRALDKVRTQAGGRTPFLVYKDSVYYAAPTADYVPPGLEINPAICGRWKLHRQVPLDDALVDMIETGTPEIINKAIKAASER